jgi:hypothetical protein
MNLAERKNSFLSLRVALENLQADELENIFHCAAAENPWFTTGNLLAAFQGLMHYLDENTFTNWLNQYPEIKNPKKIGVVMAGNIPMVGVHDLICVLVSGHHLQVKLSSQDSFLMSLLINKLIKIAPEFAQSIEVVERLKGFDAVIATGSDNTARYFDYYFNKYPTIIRKNRTSVAVLHGEETTEQLAELGKDIFTYFGLGCRNVTKLYIPENYNFRRFFEAIEPYKNIIHHHKYANNYDYNKSIFLVRNITHLDNGFLILLENEHLFSSIAVMHYEKYTSLENLEQNLENRKEKLQCIVGDYQRFPSFIDFGKAQLPEMNDYADGVDTMQFLTNL